MDYQPIRPSQAHRDSFEELPQVKKVKRDRPAPRARHSSEAGPSDSRRSSASIPLNLLTGPEYLASSSNARRDSDSSPMTGGHPRSYEGRRSVQTTPTRNRRLTSATTLPGRDSTDSRFQPTPTDDLQVDPTHRGSGPTHLQTPTRNDRPSAPVLPWANNSRTSFDGRSSFQASTRDRYDSEATIADGGRSDSMPSLQAPNWEGSRHPERHWSSVTLNDRGPGSGPSSHSHNNDSHDQSDGPGPGRLRRVDTDTSEANEAASFLKPASFDEAEEDDSRWGHFKRWYLPYWRTFWRYKIPILTTGYFLIGLTFSIAHCVVYATLNGWIVGGPSDQEMKIRIGTACAFLSQLALSMCVWITYMQWVWRTVIKTELTVNALNKGFGADTNVIDLLNWEMVKKNKVGFVMGMFAWSLYLPPFFTPATLFTYPSTAATINTEVVPTLAIADSSFGRRFAYSPPTLGNTTKFMNDTSRTFSGPRTILNLLASGTASLGNILPIAGPTNHSEYSISFYGPIVNCTNADPEGVSLIDRLYRENMRLPFGTSNQIDSAYFAFVPIYNSTGQVISLSEPRVQSQYNALNQMWMTFIRYSYDNTGKQIRERFYEVCKLHNATYDVHLKWNIGLQSINVSYVIGEEVPYPRDGPTDVSNMAQHAYSAVFWTLTDQLVGQMAWFQEKQQENDLFVPSQFGAVQTRLQETSLLGSSDLDYYFDFNLEHGLYRYDNETQISGQRLQDKYFAKNRTLPELIQQLSSNITVSLLHNVLLTSNTTASVTRKTNVNRYGYNVWGLFVPYAIATVFTALTVFMGVWSFYFWGKVPETRPQDFVAAAQEDGLSGVFSYKKNSIQAYKASGRVYFRQSRTQSGFSDF